MNTSSAHSPDSNTRLEVMDNLLSPIHLETGPLVELHQQMMSKDPDFYSRLAVWNHSRGRARDESFVATLLGSPFTEHREAGFVLLQDLSPAQVSRIVKILKRHVGKTPRSARGAVITYLRTLESDSGRLDRAVAAARRSLKHLYASLRVRPSERADRVLFKGERLAADNVDLTVHAPWDRQPTASPLDNQGVRRSTALLVDKSAGMEVSLEAGKRLAGLLSANMEAELNVYAFDLVPYLVEPDGDGPDAWQRAFRHVQAAGAMSAGSALETIRRKRRSVEQIVIVTGRDENAEPSFDRVYRDYAQQMRIRPSVFIVQVDPGAEPFVDRLQAAGIHSRAVEVEIDTLGDLLPRLSQPSRRDLLSEILAVPLPTRRAA